MKFLPAMASSAVLSMLSLSTAASATEVEAKPAKLIEFDGGQELAVEAIRVGMLTQTLSYTLTVGADGKPTGCELGRDFRRKYVEIALCRTLMKHHSFEPARDAQGNAVEGNFAGQIDFRMFFDQNGNSRANEWDG